MALKAVLATQADLDALPEAIRALYTPKNGKFYLDAESVDHDGALSRALEGERGTAAQLKRQLNELTAKLGDLDPEKAREAMEQLRKLTEQSELGEVPEQLRPVFEKVFEKRTERMKADLQNQIKAVTDALEKANKEKGDIFGQLKTLTVNGAIQKLASEKGVKPEHYEDVIARMTILGVDGVKWDLVDGKVVALDATGQVKYGKNPTQPMSFEEGFEVLATKVPGFFQPSTGGGAQNNGGGARNVNGNVMTLTEADAKNPAKYKAAKAEAEKQGLTLAIAE